MATHVANPLTDATYPESQRQIRSQAQRFQRLNKKIRWQAQPFRHPNNWHAQRFRRLSTKSADTHSVSNVSRPNQLTRTAFPASQHQIRWHAQRFQRLKHQIRWHAQQFQRLNTKSADIRNVSTSNHQIRWQAKRFQRLNTKSADTHSFSSVSTPNPLTLTTLQRLNAKPADTHSVSNVSTPNQLTRTAFPASQHQIRWHAQRFNVSTPNPLTGTALPTSQHPTSQHKICWQAQLFQRLNNKSADTHNVSTSQHQIRSHAQRFQRLNTKSVDRHSFSSVSTPNPLTRIPSPKSQKQTVDRNVLQNPKSKTSHRHSVFRVSTPTLLPSATFSKFERWHEKPFQTLHFTSAARHCDRRLWITNRLKCSEHQMRWQSRYYIHWQARHLQKIQHQILRQAQLRHNTCKVSTPNLLTRTAFPKVSTPNTLTGMVYPQSPHQIRWHAHVSDRHDHTRRQAWHLHTLANKPSDRHSILIGLTQNLLTSPTFADYQCLNPLTGTILWHLTALQGLNAKSAYMHNIDKFSVQICWHLPALCKP